MTLEESLFLSTIDSISTRNVLGTQISEATLMKVMRHSVVLANVGMTLQQFEETMPALRGKLSRNESFHYDQKRLEALVLCKKSNGLGMDRDCSKVG